MWLSKLLQRTRHWKQQQQKNMSKNLVCLSVLFYFALVYLSFDVIWFFMFFSLLVCFALLVLFWFFFHYNFLFLFLLFCFCFACLFIWLDACLFTSLVKAINALPWCGFLNCFKEQDIGSSSNKRTRVRTGLSYLFCFILFQFL